MNAECHCPSAVRSDSRTVDREQTLHPGRLAYQTKQNWVYHRHESYAREWLTLEGDQNKSAHTAGLAADLCVGGHGRVGEVEVEGVAAVGKHLIEI